MNAITAFLYKLEAGATHLVTVIETDAKTAEQRVVAAIHVMEGDVVGTYNRVASEMTAEFQAKLAAVKSALGV